MHCSVQSFRLRKGNHAQIYIFTKEESYVKNEYNIPSYFDFIIILFFEYDQDKNHSLSL